MRFSGVISKIVYTGPAHLAEGLKPIKSFGPCTMIEREGEMGAKLLGIRSEELQG
jgi:hypothetical protein